jgi:homoserine O-succinyltransferase/O-acetyltransferase
VSKNRRQVFVTGHSEYEPNTLREEYQRDLLAGLNPEIPSHYFPDNNPSNMPRVNWRSHANLLFQNWLNHYVYQVTPFNPEEIN